MTLTLLLGLGDRVYGPFLREISGSLSVEGISRAWERFAGSTQRHQWATFFECYGFALRESTDYRPFLDAVARDWSDAFELGLLAGGVDSQEVRSRARILTAALHGLMLAELATPGSTVGPSDLRAVLDYALPAAAA